jgi:hypothetical protein
VVVEPACIVAEGERVEGLRAVFVALTGATKTLVVVHVDPLRPSSEKVLALCAQPPGSGLERSFPVS